MLGKTPENAGEMDAIHIPIVSASCDDYIHKGQYVRFIDEDLTKVESCEMSFAHGIVDPLNEEFIGKNDLFYVIILPGRSTPVRHHFELITEETELEKELKQIREKDSNCAECWVIENGKIIRY